MATKSNYEKIRRLNRAIRLIDEAQFKLRRARREVVIVRDQLRR